MAQTKRPPRVSHKTLPKRRVVPTEVPARPRWRIALAWVLGIVGILFALVVILASIAQLVGGEVLRGPLSRMASGVLGREVAMDRLELDVLSLEPAAQIENLRIGNIPLAGMASPTGPMASISRTEVAIWAPALLRGRVVFSQLMMEGPDIRLARNRKGESNWNFGGGDDGSLPLANHVLVKDGRFALDDRKKDIRLDGRFGMEDRDNANSGNVLVAGGRGVANGQPLSFRLTGGALSQVDDDRPYPLRLRVQAGDTVLAAAGEIIDPTNPATFVGPLRVRGNDLEDLYAITGIALPNTPPYDVSMQVEGRGREFVVTGIKGRLGDSDIAGTARIDLRRARLYAKADLKTQRLDFDDLAAVLGAPPAVGAGETASARQQAQAARLAAEARIFPDAKLKVQRIRTMDADVTYHAEKVRMTGVPLEQLNLTLSLKDGVLTMDPLTLGLAGGSATGDVRLDAREDVPHVTVDMRARGLQVGKFFATAVSGTQPAMDGTLMARVQIEGRGLSVREAVGTANGRVVLVIPNGRMRRAFAELMGINLANGLGLLLSDDKSETVLRCGVADFAAVNGQLNARTLVLDTGPVVATGTGGVNLGEERLNLRLQGHPKELRVLRVFAPVEITGRMRKPTVNVVWGGSATQAGTAIALGALLTPVAAIFPFLDPGLADDVDCRALVQRVRATRV